MSLGTGSGPELPATHRCPHYHSRPATLLKKVNSGSWSSCRAQSEGVKADVEKGVTDHGSYETAER